MSAPCYNCNASGRVYLSGPPVCPGCDQTEFRCGNDPECNDTRDLIPRSIAKDCPICKGRGILDNAKQHDLFFPVKV